MTVGLALKKYWKAALAFASVPAALAGTYMAIGLSHPLDLSRYERRSTEMLDRTGQLIRLYPVEDGRIRIKADLDTIDPGFIDMLVAFEDQRYFSHSGVDPLATLRAAWQAVTAGEVVSGASTLSMQTAKLLNPRPRTLGAKIIEMVQAGELERRFSKRQILEIYLTLAPYGGNLEGIEAASQAYFGHDSRHLSPHEAALLVALPQSPTRLRPDRNPMAARAARNKVLNRVAPLVGLDDHHLMLAIKAPVPDTRADLPLMALHYTDRLYARHKGADRVETSLDAALQAKLETLAARAAQATHGNASAAILVIDNKSRAVRAYVGSAGLKATARDGFVDMVTAVRSPGSTLKPLIYGLAFERGLARPATIIRDEPRDFGGYKPSNFMDRHYGDISIAEALQRSLNIPAVAVLDRLGPVRFTEKLRQTGIPVELPGDEAPGLAVALGGLGLRLEDLVALYAALADDGRVIPILDTVPDEVPVFLSAEARADITDILQGIDAPEGRLEAVWRPTDRGIAYKTGTSYGFRDSWAIGYDADHTVGVWVGRPDGTPLPGHYGSNTAAPVLFQAFDLLPMPKGKLQAAKADSLADLSPGLRYFDRPARLMVAGAEAPTLAIRYPLDGSLIELPADMPKLTLEADGGKRPLRWFVNGRPEPLNRWAREGTVTLQSGGFYELVVMDAAGNRARVSVETRMTGTFTGGD